MLITDLSTEIVFSFGTSKTPKATENQTPAIFPAAKCIQEVHRRADTDLKG